MWILLAISLLTSHAYASCDKGCQDMGGVCACDAPSEQAASVTDPAVVSDEKPRREQQPEWETGEVHADLSPSQRAIDELFDKQKREADAQGKKAAGIK